MYRVLVGPGALEGCFLSITLHLHPSLNTPLLLTHPSQRLRRNVPEALQCKRVACEGVKVVEEGEAQDEGDVAGCKKA